jgi:hypothetical protein
MTPCARAIQIRVMAEEKSCPALLSRLAFYLLLRDRLLVLLYIPAQQVL